jgi:hypothetical protein
MLVNEWVETLWTVLNVRPKTLQAVGGFLGREFAESLNDLSNSLKPQVGSGYVICLASSLVGLGILIFLWKTSFKSRIIEDEVDQSSD